MECSIHTVTNVKCMTWQMPQLLAAETCEVTSVQSKNSVLTRSGWGATWVTVVVGELDWP
jgi:hypothetical protein